MFFIDTDKIRKIAIEAAYAEYPDIPPAGLVDRTSNTSFDVSCHSALEAELVFTIEEDFHICIARLHYRIKETMDTREYVDSEGRCLVEIESEVITVGVRSDGTPKVIMNPLLTISTEECTEEVEGWSN